MKKYNHTEQFDFIFDDDHYQINSKPNKNKQKKQVHTEQILYQHEEQIKSIKSATKLPHIHNKNQYINYEQNSSTKDQKRQTHLQNLNIKKDTRIRQSKYEEMIESDHEHKISQNKQKKNGKVNVAEKNKKQSDDQKNQQENYEEDFQMQYQQDFEDFHQQEQSKQYQKQIQKYQANKAVPKRQQSLKKQISKKSLKSIKSSGSQSRVRQTFLTQREQTVKYVTEIAKQFPDINLNNLNVEKLTKLNQRMRNTIRKINNELTELLNKNALLLKSKKQDVKQKSLEDRLRLFYEQKKNNEKQIQRMITEIKKLKVRQLEVKQQQYEINLMQDIQAYSQKKKQFERIINKIKLEVSYESKKFNNVVQKKQTELVNQQQKSQYLYLKKQEDKNLKRLDQLEVKISSLTQKTEEIENKFKKILKEAQDKGIQLEPKSNQILRYQQLKKKKNNQKKNLSATQILFKNKIQRLNQQMMLFRRKISINELQIKNLYNEIQYLIKQSFQAIEKTKENPKFIKSIENSLQMISKSLQNQPIQQYQKMTQKTQKSNRSRLTQEKQKYNKILQGKSEVTNPQEKKNKEYSLPPYPRRFQKNQQTKVENMKIKPNFSKKKEQIKQIKQVKQQLKQEQTVVYNQRKQKSEKQIEKQKIIQQQPKEDLLLPLNDPQPIKLKQQPLVIQQSKSMNSLSKPFMFKKKLNNETKGSMSDINSNIINNISNIQPEKKQEIIEKKDPMFLLQEYQKKNNFDEKVINIPNRIARFKRNNGSEYASQENKDNQQTEKAKSKFNLINQSEVKQVIPFEQRPISLPKRFGLKRRNDQNREQTSNYNPTLLQKPQLKYTEFNLTNQYRLSNQNILNPQSTFKNQLNFNINNKQLKSISNHQIKKQNPSTEKNNFKIQMKNQSQNITTNNIPNIPNTNLNSINSNMNIQYAQQQINLYGLQQNNQYVPQREGKLKKPKIEGTKQKFSIYDAQEPNINNVLKSSKQQLPITKRQQLNSHKNQQVDINQLLGIKPKKNNDMEDLLFGEAKIQKRKYENKKPNDFFGFQV